MVLDGLDTGGIDPIAFWNFLDKGGDSIDPFETESAMASFQEYSNGVDGTYNISLYNEKTRTANVRVKEDGWIIAWFDSSDDSFDQNITDATSIDGDFDLLNDWTDDDNPISLNEHALERVINGLYNELSNSAQATYNSSDVGLYFYDDEDATTVRFSTSQSSTTGSTSISGVVSTTSDVTLYRWYTVGAGFTESFGGHDSDVIHDNGDDDVVIVQIGSDDERYGAHDGVLNNTVDPGDDVTEYLLSDGYQGSNDTYAQTCLGTMVLWG